MQPLSWYVNRVSLMSPGEIAWRISQSVRARIEQGRRNYSAPPADASVIALPTWQPPGTVTAALWTEAAEQVLAGNVDLFGQPTRVGFPDVDWNRDPVSGRRAPATFGKSIDYRDANLVGGARYTWEVNRHFQLVALAQAAAVTREARYRQGVCALLTSWLRACPYPVGINWASALEHGLRLTSWYLAARLCGFSGPAAEPVPGWLSSIYWHCRFIEENRSKYSSANNHLIGEAAGLYIAACAWPCWTESRRWRSLARRVLEQEAHRQVHPDGVAREQTTGYQIFVLQMLIIAGLAGELHDQAFPPEYWTSVRRMIGFLRAIADRNGNLPDFGDSDDGMVLILSPLAREQRLADLVALDAAYSHQPHPAGASSLSAAWLLSGFPEPANWPGADVGARFSFPDGGYYVLSEERGGEREVSVVFDAAPLGYLAIAAHGHADCLSFVLSLGGIPILIDPGTYCYHDDPDWRSYFRSTAAHNTIRVDGLDQSEQGGPFMWLRKARPSVELAELDASVQRVHASHDGYGRLRDPVVHRREIALEPGRSSLDVLDTLECRATHRVERFWHFAPGCSVSQPAPGLLRIEAQGAQVELRSEPELSARLLRGSRNPVAGWCSPAFGRLEPTTTAVFAGTICGTAALRTRIQWVIS